MDTILTKYFEEMLGNVDEMDVELDNHSLDGILQARVQEQKDLIDSHGRVSSSFRQEALNTIIEENFQYPKNEAEEMDIDVLGDEVIKRKNLMNQQNDNGMGVFIGEAENGDDGGNIDMVDEVSAIQTAMGGKDLEIGLENNMDFDLGCEQDRMEWDPSPSLLHTGKGNVSTMDVDFESNIDYDDPGKQ